MSGWRLPHLSRSDAPVVDEEVRAVLTDLADVDPSVVAAEVAKAEAARAKPTARVARPVGAESSSVDPR